ncbi:MAG: hypothetical protein QM775_28080 [Pirellulales bacterium]
MRRRLLYSYACSLLLGGATFAHADDTALVEPLVTNSPSFSIPFELQVEPGRQSEAHLFVSGDLGKSWQAAGRAIAPAVSFEYRAPTDGEFWFVVRTEPTTPAAVAAEKPEPELRVVVDSTPPKLELAVEPAADGTLLIRWKADDAELAAEPLKINYRFAGSSDMQPVDTARGKRQLDKRSGSGEMHWRPVVSDRKLAIVAELRDAAGNSVIREIEPAALAASAAPSLTTPSVAPVANNPPSAAPVGMPNLAVAAPASVPVSSAQSAAVPPLPIRDPTKPLMVNSLSFELDYDVEKAAGRDVTKVEVWGTRDDGRSWVMLGLDEDRRTPCSVNVDAEGMYGFAIIVESAGGLKGVVPQAGQAPEIRVGVDLTQPLVRLTTAEPDEKNSPCRLKINWEAQDANLGAQAVTLSYSANPQGPWIPLAQGVAPAGGHVCDFDPQGPDYAFLKIDVRDEAGNVGSFATTTAIPIEKRQVQFSFAGASKPEETPAKPKWFHVLR